ncbi:MAG TPA: hypothetical protein VIE90_18785 [Candidatus Binatia bacterium]|jgi:hypothetical protein
MRSGRVFVIVVALLALFLTSCAYRLTLHARDGEKLDGEWRFGQEGGGFIQVFADDGEVLAGKLAAVPRENFLDGYRKTFGRGSIEAVGPDLSAYGNGLWGPLGSSSNALLDVVYGESFNPAANQSRNAVSGPLFYWIADLQGDRRTSMQCFLIGSSYSARGLGRCKNDGGQEYTVEF